MFQLESPQYPSIATHFLSPCVISVVYQLMFYSVSSYSYCIITERGAAIDSIR